MEPRVLNERYRLIKSLGSGGMATVYRGHDLLLDRPIAIKILRQPYAGDPDFRDRFLEEARSAAQLDHPNIVQVYDVGIDNEEPYLIMELVEGEDLKAKIRKAAPFPLPRALDVTQQICAGVGAAHNAGIVHCDLKPQNVLVTENGQVKVTDFGIARAFQEEHPESEEREQVVWGSPHYLSPEQATGESPVPASDVYSIGVMLYEMLTGVPPFHAEDTTELLIKHLRETPTPPSALNPQIPPRLTWLVNKVLAKGKSGRYRNADQLGLALEQYQKQGAEATVPQAAVPAPTADEPQSKTATGTPKAAAPPKHKTPVPPAKETTSQMEPDWLLWLLLGVAAVAVLGLIPLWLRVAQVYSQNMTPPPVTTETTTATPSGEQVSVPNLVGLNVTDAEELAAGYDLQLNVAAEEKTTDALPGTVLRQDPGAGSRVAVNTTIDVVKAVGQVFALQDVVGYTLGDVRDPLEAQGLIVETQEVWSAEPKGRILEQDPPAESEIQAGETLTLTVSGGTDARIPLQVNLGDIIVLEEANIPRTSFRPEDSVPVTLYWRAQQPIDRTYVVFVHLIPQGEVAPIAQDDSEPGNGTNPTNTWEPGEIVIDPHQVKVPAGTPAGRYALRVGMYTGEGRLPIFDTGQSRASDGSIFIANVEIIP